MSSALQFSVKNIFTDKVSKLIKKAVADRISGSTNRVSKSLRNYIPGTIRYVIEQHAPLHYQGVFKRVLRKVRYGQDDHPTRTGFGYDVTNSTVHLTFFAEEKHDDDLASVNYGHSDYWAVIVAIKGRKAYSVGGEIEIIAVPQGVIGKNGLVLSVFPQHVRRVPKTGWFEEAMEHFGEHMRMHIADILKKGK